MRNLRVKVFVIFSLLLLSLSVSSVFAQYDGAVTSNIVIASDGTSNIHDSFGVTYNIQGTPGSSGTVTTDIRTSNPQPNANTPSGIELTYFVIVTFDMNAADFISAQITIPYTDSDVSGIEQPYAIFKYSPVTDTYFELAADIDTNAQTFIVTVTSVDDPLFAIGGASVSGSGGGFSSLAWVALTASIVIIVVLVIVGFWYFKKDSK